MAYTILKTDGTVLCTIPDGTINTANSSVGLAGRNYAGYGQILDTNFVHIIENFANSAVPAHPILGQLWFDTSANVLRICPADGEVVASNWYTVSSTNSTGQTVFNTVTITGDLTVNGNITSLNQITAADANVVNIAVSGNANVTTANIANTITRVITTGGSGVTGSMTGTWTFTGGSSLTVPTFSVTGTANVTTANIGTTLTTLISTGSYSTPGSLTGNWTLTSGSRLQSTYADVAERFESDTMYEAGTVVEIGGDKEVTAVKYDLSDDVFGVVSDTAGYLLNSAAGDDITHPAIAMSGRVKVNVVGRVFKGERLVSAGNGIARAAKTGEATAFNTIGRSLEDKTSEGPGKILAIVTIK